MLRCRSYCFCQCLSASLECINASCCCAECENEVRGLVADNNHESLILNNSICIQLNYSMYKERKVTCFASKIVSVVHICDLKKAQFKIKMLLNSDITCMSQLLGCFVGNDLEMAL